ncbi:lipoprotein NlpI [Phycisphaerae bacterium RAS2]|nr:lipoprotein NlpI [Phycisphaerae bacterium RAS2]
MDSEPDNLVAFLAREHDAMAESPGACPDENVWASLETGLLSPEQRDELLVHAQVCSPCRRRMSEIVGEWPADMAIPETARESGGSALPTGRGPNQDTRGAGPRAGERNILFRIGPRHYAIAAALLMAVTLWLAWPGGAPDASLLGTPIARLTDFGDIGILQRRTLSERTDPQRQAVTELAARLEAHAAKNPNEADVWRDLARAQLRLGRIESAASAARRATAAAPNRAELQNLAGLIAYRTGHYVEAVEAFGEAIRLAPGVADYHLNAALALEELQRIDEAMLHWKEFLRLAPRDPRAEEAARWIGVLQGRTDANPATP